jgi:hypothetical protein
MNGSGRIWESAWCCRGQLHSNFLSRMSASPVLTANSRSSPPSVNRDRETIAGMAVLTVILTVMKSALVRSKMERLPDESRSRPETPAQTDGRNNPANPEERSPSLLEESYYYRTNRNSSTVHVAGRAVRDSTGTKSPGHERIPVQM